MAGRKSLKDEIKIVERLSALSEPTFVYLESCLTTGEPSDKRWAVEQMIKLYAKCIPTEVVTDPENPLSFTLINYGNQGAVSTSPIPDPATPSVR